MTYNRTKGTLYKSLLSGCLFETYVSLCMFIRVWKCDVKCENAQLWLSRARKLTFIKGNSISLTKRTIFVHILMLGRNKKCVNTICWWLYKFSGISAESVRILQINRQVNTNTEQNVLLEFLWFTFTTGINAKGLNW